MVETYNRLAVKADGVTKKIISGDSVLDVLRGVDLEAPLGEMQMIVGPSGSGKTTLLSIIAGTLSFDGGSVVVLEKSIKELSREELADFRKKNIGFIFQQYHLIKTLTCQQNVAIPLLLNNIPNQTALEKASEMLKKVGLGAKDKTYPSHLSGGEQQRVSIARALVHNPRLLICDEPTSALDTESGAVVMKLLKEIAKSQERCVLVVTHDTRILSYADRIIQMEDGIITTYEKQN